MIKVFLVEDEYAIREGIKKSVNWESHGFTLVGEAGDGEVAYPKILSTRPDILITDIRMPFMDGLELAKLVKKELPDIRIIVLSGYDDFNYAKQAISIGVEEYMLKPVSGDTLINELQKVAEIVTKEKQDREAREQYQRDREEIRRLEQQNFIRDMIDGRLSMQESLEKGRDLGIDIAASAYAIVLMQIFSKDRGTEDMHEYSGDVEEIYGKLKTTYEDQPHVYLYKQIGDVLCFLEKADSMDELNENIKEGINGIKEIMDDYKDRIYFISVGMPVERIRDVNRSYLDAGRKFSERFMLDESTVFYGDITGREKIGETLQRERRDSDVSKMDIGSIDISKVDVSAISQKTIYNFLRNGTLQEIDDLVNEYFASIGEDAIESIMLRQYVLVEALISSYTFLENLGLSKEKAGELLGELADPVKFVPTSEKSKEYIKKLLQCAIEYRNKVSDQRYLEIIDKAKQLIEENYKDEMMSLQYVASSVNISSNHFSAVFRKETGVTFIDYLTEVRMNAAKNLLVCTSMKTSDVGYEVGYRDSHYFSYIFKKSTGMSPKEYRRAKKES